MKVGDTVTYSNRNRHPHGKTAYGGYTGKCTQISEDNSFIIESETSALCCGTKGNFDRDLKVLVIVNGEYELVTKDKIINKDNANFFQKIWLVITKHLYLHKEN